MYAERKTNVKRVPSSPYGLRRGRQENYFIFFFSKGLYPKARGADVNRITATTFDVSGNSVTRTAVDPDHNGNTSDNQATVYNYQDPYNPATVTRIKYPDSVDARFDSITMTYALDGQVVTRTAQRKTDAATPTT